MCMYVFFYLISKWLHFLKYGKHTTTNTSMKQIIIKFTLKGGILHHCRSSSLLLGKQLRMAGYLGMYSQWRPRRNSLGSARPSSGHYNCLRGEPAGGEFSFSI